MEPLIPLEKNVLDNSKLEDYQRCPRYFFYRHVLGWDSEAPNNHLVFGTSWHLAMEHLILHGYGDTSVIEAHNIFLSDYRKTFLPETDELFEPKTPSNAFLVLAKYAQKYNGELEHTKVMFTEIAGSVAIDEKHMLSFRMDSVLKNLKTEKMFSREHKTGSRTWMWDEQWILGQQPGMYNHVLYCLYPFDEVEGVEMNGSFFIKRKSDPYDFRRFTVKKRKDQMQVWIDNVRYYLWEIDREYSILNDSKEEDPTLRAFPLRTHNCLEYSRVCAYQDFCLAWPNPLRKMHQPPMGFKVRYWNPLEREAKKTLNIETKVYEV